MNIFDNIENKFDKKPDIIDKSNNLSFNIGELDNIICNKGIPKGKLIEFYGKESSGKTTIAYKLIANLQKQNASILLIDTTCSFDNKYAEDNGVDSNLLVYSKDDDGNIEDLIKEVLEGDIIDLVIIDSIANLNTIKLQKLIPLIHKSKTCVIYTNQIRYNIKKREETVASVKGFRFYTDIRINFKRIETLKKQDERIGYKLELNITKNKNTNILKSFEYDIYYGGNK